KQRCPSPASNSQIRPAPRDDCPSPPCPCQDDGSSCPCPGGCVFCSVAKVPCVAGVAVLLVPALGPGDRVADASPPYSPPFRGQLTPPPRPCLSAEYAESFSGPRSVHRRTATPCRRRAPFPGRRGRRRRGEAMSENPSSVNVLEVPASAQAPAAPV